MSFCVVCLPRSDILHVLILIGRRENGMILLMKYTLCNPMEGQMKMTTYCVLVNGGIGFVLNEDDI